MSIVITIWCEGRPGCLEHVSTPLVNKRKANASVDVLMHTARFHRWEQSWGKWKCPACAAPKVPL